MKKSSQKRRMLDSFRIQKNLKQTNKKADKVIGGDPPERGHIADHQIRD